MTNVSTVGDRWMKQPRHHVAHRVLGSGLERKEVERGEV